MLSKLIKWLAGIVLAFLIIATVAFFFISQNLDAIVAGGIETIGSKATGAPVTVETVNFSLAGGTADIAGLVVGSPEGYKADTTFRLESVHVTLEPGSVFSDTVHIREILIVGPDVTCEMKTPTKNNLIAIKNNVMEFAGPAKEKEAADKPKKQVRIDRLEITEGKIGIAASFLGGRGVKSPMPPIKIQDIGGGDGADVGETLILVMRQVSSVVTTVAQSAIKGIADGVKNIQDIKKAADAVGGAGESLKGAAEGVMGGVKGLLNGKDDE